MATLHTIVFVIFGLIISVIFPPLIILVVIIAPFLHIHLKRQDCPVARKSDLREYAEALAITAEWGYDEQFAVDAMIDTMNREKITRYDLPAL